MESATSLAVIPLKPAYFSPVDLDGNRRVVQLLLELNVAQAGDLFHPRFDLLGAGARVSARFGLETASLDGGGRAEAHHLADHVSRLRNPKANCSARARVDSWVNPCFWSRSASQGLTLRGQRLFPQLLAECAGGECRNLAEGDPHLAVSSGPRMNRMRLLIEKKRRHKPAPAKPMEMSTLPRRRPPLESPGSPLAQVWRVISKSEPGGAAEADHELAPNRPGGNSSVPEPWSPAPRARRSRPGRGRHQSRAAAPGSRPRRWNAVCTRANEKSRRTPGTKR